jgi:predicted nucleic acid-binding protein
VSVVDASVWVSGLVTQDAFHEPSRRWLYQHGADGGLLVAPVLVAEVAGAIARLQGDPQFGLHAIDQLLALPTLELVPDDIAFGEAAARLAANLLLRGPDSAYVPVARERNLPLVSWDREQRQRASAIVAVRAPQ